jgi:hypothetical protein
MGNSFIAARHVALQSQVVTCNHKLKLTAQSLSAR